MWADRVPDADATAVAKLSQAGTILLGKLAMHEFALGGPDPTSLFPLARDPWNLAHLLGGSSSGSGAAVAAGLCMGALGSDTGGSIRGPASLGGIVGLKPTLGRVSNYGVVPLVPVPGLLRADDLHGVGRRSDAPGHCRTRSQGPHHRRGSSPPFTTGRWRATLKECPSECPAATFASRDRGWTRTRWPLSSGRR